MDAFESKFIKVGSSGLYMVLAFLSFYCASFRLPVGVKYGVNLLVLGWACVMFFIRPMFDRAVFCLRFFALFFFPYLMFWMWSVAIWISEFQTFAYILRGSLNVFYMFTNLLFVSATIYLFGTKSVTLTMISMAIANGIAALQVAARAGVGTFIAEYVRLLLTFADDTGSAMHQMELHDMVYGWGVCALYYMIHKEKSVKKQVLCLLVSWLFFTMGFKRIAVPAVVGAAMLYIFLCLWRPKNLRKLATVAAVAAGGGIFLYLWTIKSGLFVKTANELGINLMYRDIIYTYFSDFFELNPTYLGRGVRFVYTFCTEDPSYHLATTALHNVYMELYIEVGFWCWWVWILFELAFRVHRVAEWYSDVPAYALMAMNCYVFFTYLTDNTSFYFVISVMYHMAVMVFCLEQQEEKKVRSLWLPKEDKNKEMQRKEEEVKKKEERCISL